MSTGEWSVEEKNWIREGLSDYVGLWQIVRFVADEVRPCDDERSERLSLT